MAKGFGGGMPGNMQGILKQAQKMQEQIKKAQEDSESFVAEGSAGGGMVKVVVNGKFTVTSTTINPEVMNDKDMLQDLFCAAANEALQKVKDNAQNSMSAATGGMNIPGLF